MYLLVLGLTRDASRDQIVKSYRNMARKFHPDMHKGSEAKAEASKRFLVIASAYEVLKDEESRKEYDYMLDNPEEVYRHYYNYFRRQYAPKVDIRIVLFVTISLISAFQYYGGHSKYKEAIDYFVTVPKYRLKAQEIAESDGLIKRNQKIAKGKTKQQVREEEELILRKIIEERMHITGGHSKPSYKDILWIQMALFPYYLVQLIIFYLRWFYKFSIKKEEYGTEEKEYLIRRYMKLNQAQWDTLDEDLREEYLEQELWIKDNFKVWKEEKDEEEKARLAESASYKRYRRWMKKGGPGQITFGED